MSSYFGLHAKLYDSIYRDKPYKKEAQFIHECFKRYGSSKISEVLELGCGTGNHAFELEKFGYKLSALDYSQDMLNQARLKAERLNSKVKFMLMDMRELPVFKKKFDSVMCLFDSLGYVLTNDAIRKVLHGIHKNLKKNGLFIFDFWHASAMIKHFDPFRKRTFGHQELTFTRTSKTSLDLVNQIAIVDYVIKGVGGKGYTSHKETQKNRFFLLQEMTLFLTISGFQVLKYFDGYIDKENIDDKSFHVLAVAQKI